MSIEDFFLPIELVIGMIQGTVIWGGICLALEVIQDIYKSTKHNEEED